MEKSVKEIKSKDESPDEQKNKEKETKNITFIEETKDAIEQKNESKSSTNPKKSSDGIVSVKQELEIISFKMEEKNEKEKGLNGQSQNTNGIVLKEESEQLQNPSREVKKKNEIDSALNKKSNNDQDLKGKNRKTVNKVQQKIPGVESIKKQNSESPKKSKKSKSKSDQVGKETSKDKQSKQTEIEGRRRCESESLEQKRSNKFRIGLQPLKKMYSMDQTPTPVSPSSQKKSLADSDPQLSMWSEELNALNYVEGIRRGIDSKKLPPPPPALQPAQQTFPSQQQMKGGSISNDTAKHYEVVPDKQHSTQDKSSSMNQGSCPLYFGVKSYLHHFYGSIDEKLIRDNVDDFEYMIGPSGEKEHPLVGNYSERGCHCGNRACRRFWLRAGLWGGVNFLLVGLIALLVGYLTPPRATLVEYQDNIEIVDHWAIIFNKRLEVCRLAGLAVFCTGGVVLLIALLAFNFWSECPRCYLEKIEDLDPHQPIIINPVRIPINEQIRSVQPTSGQSTNFLVIQ